MQPLPRSAVPTVVVVVAAASLLASGCGGSADPQQRAATTRFPHDAPTLLAAGTGNLEGSASFRLTTRIAMPAEKGRAAYRLDMSGVWDARQQAGRMDGVLKGARATVLSIGGTEYVSVPPNIRKRTGRTWLRAARGTRTFADFPDVHRLAMVLRTAERPSVTAEAGATWHVRGTIARTVALRKIPDPAVRAFASALPATTGFDLWTDDAGRPNRIRLTPAGDAKKITGTVELSDFGARPNVQEPTGAQILDSLPTTKRD
ncbi:LolA-like protein [Actinomadura rudentiformis]|uniref:LppX_LprAFG lipoprotein n=1 Tax=Actinomadura rudentiformis TaxID=359158 RepID=A0A6H9YPB1_9ACTN|nr:hypothetical protein [Actinomadura rudentiformis]KAB2349533.1 hypothetical protein F8566_12200 [Actinomadura rudentiformis]